MNFRDSAHLGWAVDRLFPVSLSQEALSKMRSTYWLNATAARQKPAWHGSCGSIVTLGPKLPGGRAVEELSIDSTVSPRLTMSRAQAVH